MHAMRRRYGRPRQTAWIALALLAALAGWRVWAPWQAPAPESLAAGTYRVERVVDGDTLLLANRARVRLIGVDAPESVKPDAPLQPWGAEAADFTRQFISAAGGQVRLQFDRERVDRFDRFLAYAWNEDRLLNEELLRAGLARARTEFNYSSSMKRRFRAAEAEAESQGRGIWSR
jgi:micrococcal nuclease